MKHSTQQMTRSYVSLSRDHHVGIVFMQKLNPSPFSATMHGVILLMQVYVNNTKSALVAMLLNGRVGDDGVFSLSNMMNVLGD